MPETAPTRPLVPSPSVRSAGDDEHLVLLDLAAGEYSMLNATGAAVWRRLQAGVDPRRVADELAADGNGGDAGTRRQVEGLIAHLTEEGLLVPVRDGHGGAAADQSPAGPPLVAEDLAGRDVRPSLRTTLEAWLVLLRLDLLAARRGFGRLLAALPPCPPDADPPADAARVAATVAAVRRAAAFHPRKAWCLPFSATCTWVLRRRGIPARLVLGVRPLPFFAHAWTEVGGRVVNDGDHVRELYVLDRF